MGFEQTGQKLKVGQTFTIRDVSGDEVVRSRLLELGFIPGQTFVVCQKISARGPFVVKSQGATVALRKEELACIQI